MGKKTAMVVKVDAVMAIPTSEAPSLAARDFSFPSNHTARTTAFVVIIGFWFTLRRNDNIVGKILWIYPLSIGFSRLYLLQNYFFDVVGGILYGMIIAMILCKLLKPKELSDLNRFN